ncbi:PTS sugar transporter subunit IIA [Deferribacterales bacterium Es71-Z0220]|uniref:PTS sugar transporter subunit IIA n=1 Tax=Deferrivibrio essentukiensis TaxID=2880922 RepID=UPI001F605CD2|nr:PTS sugar transporter subunit IIA [Deferrivibrio essentukiensis]MCB4204494.1 PTS sugar transporter subunit IIA [Deferrivibrio essentukiensis]
MVISEIVEKNDIIFLDGDFTKDDIFKKFSEIFVERGKIKNFDEVYNSLLEREKLGSTAVGEEIAIPHAKFKDIDNTCIVISISKNGILFDAPDKLPVKVFFVVLSPESNIAGHLKTLAKISRLAKLTDFKNRAVNATNAEEVLKILVEEESKV